MTANERQWFMPEPVRRYGMDDHENVQELKINRVIVS